MWKRLSQRITDPILYRKYGAALARPFRFRKRKPGTRSLEDLLTAIGDSGSATVILAHPDDEIFCAGLICSLVDHHVPVDLVCLTRGEGGIADTPDAIATLGGIREAELRESVRALGIRSLQFLNHRDPKAKEYRVYAPPVDRIALANQLRTVLRDTLPETRLILTHGTGGEYWHPAHLLLHHAVHLAVGEKPITRVSMNAWQPDHPLKSFLNRDDCADLLIDSRPHRERRHAIISSHASQREFFAHHGGGVPDEFANRLEGEAYRVDPPRLSSDGQVNRLDFSTPRQSAGSSPRDSQRCPSPDSATASS